MKKTALILSMILMSSQSFAGAGLNQKITKFLDTDPTVQKLILEQSIKQSCSPFGEFQELAKKTLEEQRALTEEAILSHAGDLEASAIAEVKSDIIEIDKTLDAWPAGITKIISGQSDCANGEGQRGVSVSVGVKADGSLVLVGAGKY